MARITLALILLVLAALAGCGGSSDQPSATSATTATTFTPTSASGTMWEEFTSEGGRYSVLMPGQPEEETIAMETASGEVQATFARMEVDEVTYMVVYIDLPPESLEIGNDEYFRQYIDNVVQKVESDSGAELGEPEIREINLRGNPGREFTIAAEDMMSRHRIYLVSDRQYMIQATGPEEKVSTDETTRYLDSFKLIR